MGTPSDTVTSTFFMRTRKMDHYMNINSERSPWIRYKDAVILIFLGRTHLEGTTGQQNGPHPRNYIIMKEVV